MYELLCYTTFLSVIFWIVGIPTLLCGCDWWMIECVRFTPLRHAKVIDYPITTDTCSECVKSHQESYDNCYMVTSGSMSCLYSSHVVSQDTLIQIVY